MRKSAVTTHTYSDKELDVGEIEQGSTQAMHCNWSAVDRRPVIWAVSNHGEHTRSAAPSASILSQGLNVSSPFYVGGGRG